MAMDADEFKDLGLSVGQRLAVLKAVYLVKLAHDIPMGPEDYVPPSESIHMWKTRLSLMLSCSRGCGEAGGGERGATGWYHRR
jgi:hypothetical protein